MNRSTTLAMSAVGAMATAAFAQPANFSDLGNHSTTGQFSTPVMLQSPTDIQWFKVVLPVTPAGSPAYVDIWTVSGGDNPMTDTEVGVYDSTGALKADDDDSSDGLYTALSFGATTPTRPAIGAGLAFDGRDGVLDGGVHWVAVGRFNVTFGASNWDVTSTYAGAQTTTLLNFDVFSATESYPPSGVGVVTPNVVVAGTSAVFSVNVTPGGNPASTGITVLANLGSFGGPAALALLDNGTNGDVAAGDGVYSATSTVPSSATAGDTTWTFAVSDAQARTGNGTGTFRIAPVGTWVEGSTDAGDTIATAQATAGSGNLPAIMGTTSAAGDVDIYAFNLCTPGSFAATLVGTGTAGDTQLFLFNADGTGIVMNDDDPSGTGGLLSALSSTFTASLSTGTYYLAISRYDNDPLAADGQAIWADQPFGAERAPDGLNPTGVLTSWTGGGGTGAYQINMTGACLGGGGGGCVADVDDGTRTGTSDGAVTVDDLIYFLIAFEDGGLDADVDNGTQTGTTDGAVTIDDLVYFLIRFEEGC